MRFIFMWVLLQSLLWLHSNALLQGFLPLLTGEFALQGLFRIGAMYIGTLVYILSGVHSGYKRQTMHTEPEFEQIIEVLDVPDDVYQKLQRKKSFGIPKNYALQQAHPDVGIQRRIGGKSRENFQATPLRQRKNAKRFRQEANAGSQISTVKRFGPFRKRLSCAQLQRNIRAYRRYCSQEKVLHTDSISFLYNSYLPSMTVPSTIRKLKNKRFRLRNRFFVPSLLKEWYQKHVSSDGHAKSGK
ncbi:hypothetical protein BIW11_11365 [Tropilaelaps mercedesae]|uniref:Uncharacterized protein n=1 Tax=Tropilaelaps mercedesae TaxID=418985 RepID=A0A1V9XBV9_9ACAR|nr:hypothetical protein BIW11_11365 [Tropilaelaps mercedesae]